MHSPWADRHRHRRGFVMFLRTFAAVLVVCFLLPAAGCFEEASQAPQTDDLGDALVAAYAELEARLYQYNDAFNDLDGVDGPDDFDFSEAERLYRVAYDLDPSNATARFGLAACTLLGLTTDPAVNQAFDAWKDYLDLHWPFETEAKAAAAVDVPLGIPRNGSALELPFDLVPLTALVAAKARLTNSAPLVSHVQLVLDTVVLPRVESCIGLLEPLAANSGFVYIMSGAMQGSYDEDPAEVDQVEVLAMLASCKLLKAGIGVAVSYDVQFGGTSDTGIDKDGIAYDGATMLAGLNQTTGNIGTLIGGDPSRMQAVPALFLAAVDHIDLALDVLQAETDNQDDDVIKIGPGYVNQNDVDTIQAVDLPHIRSGFSATGARRTENWDGNWETPENEILINLLDFFESPVTDFKALLPEYELQLAVGALNDNDHFEETVTFTIPEPVDWPYYSEYYENGVLVESYGYDDFPAFRSYCQDLAAARIAELWTNPSWTGQAYFNFNIEGHFQAGVRQVPVSRYENWDIAVHVPEIHWAAPTFAAWLGAIPDPTISGLLPEMDGPGLCATFGILEEDWDPVMTFYWYDGNFGYDEPTDPLPPGAVR